MDTRKGKLRGREMNDVSRAASAELTVDLSRSLLFLPLSRQENHLAVQLLTMYVFFSSPIRLRLARS